MRECVLGGGGGWNRELVSKLVWNPHHSELSFLYFPDVH